MANHISPRSCDDPRDWQSWTARGSGLLTRRLFEGVESPARGRPLRHLPPARGPQRQRQRVRLHQLRRGRAPGDAGAAVGRRQADRADVGPDVRRRRHHVLRPVVRRQVGGVLGAPQERPDLSPVLDEPGRHEPQAADRGRQRLRLSDLRARSEDPLHDQQERRAGRQAVPRRVRARHRAGRHHQHRRHRRDAGAAQRLAPRGAGAAARRPRPLHRVAAHGHGQRRPPAHDEHRHDRHARGLRRRGRRQRRHQQLPQGAPGPDPPARTGVPITSWWRSAPRATARCRPASCC